MWITMLFQMCEGEASNQIIILMSDNCSFFSKFASSIQGTVDIAEALKEMESNYSLTAYKIHQISPYHAVEIYKSIQDKFYKKNSGQITNNWFENQLRIFVWTLICYVSHKKCLIQNLTQQDWDFFQTIFPYKDPKLFEYQTRALSVEPTKGKHWQKNEQDLLKELMRNKNEKTKWNEISKQLYHQSDKKYFRTAKQCRQHWNNHLDPSKVKGNWKPQQYLLMFQFVKQEGKKWANLVKKLGNSRNEHSIKNKFNSLVKKQKKITTGVSEQAIYDVIINRIQKHLDRDVNRQSEMSFDQDFNSSNYQPKEEVLPLAPPRIQRMAKPQIPKPTSFSSSFSQNFMQKLQKFNSPNPSSSTLNLNTTQTLEKNTPLNKKREDLFNENCSISEGGQEGVKYEQEDQEQNLLNLEIEENKVFLNEQDSPEQAQRKLKNDSLYH